MDLFRLHTVKHVIITARKRSLRRLCFYRCLSVHTVGRGMRGCFGGTCVVAPGEVCMIAPGRGACMVAAGGGGVCMVAPGGMHGCSRGGHVWLLWGVCGCSQKGVCVVAPRGAVCGIWRDTEIRSMSGRYASYWNAFLLSVSYTVIYKNFTDESTATLINAS